VGVYVCEYGTGAHVCTENRGGERGVRAVRSEEVAHGGVAVISERAFVPELQREYGRFAFDE